MSEVVAAPGALVGPVEVVGTGLLGTSLALAMRRSGVEVLLRDVDPEHVRLAASLGAGRAATDADRPQVVVVAVPPDLLGRVIVEALERTAGTDAVVTDLGSVKSGPAAAVAGHPERHRYVGSHPMAGTERSGPLTGSATLFEGRPWAITPHPDSAVSAVEVIEDMVRRTGAMPTWLTPGEHDRAVARTSHVPHLMAALVAGRLAVAPENHLSLAGPGVRDVTRVAGGDPALYGQIVSGNSTAVLELLGELRSELDTLITAVSSGDRAGLDVLLQQGRRGTAAIPGKHGGPAQSLDSVWVAVPDEAGSLARLLAAAVASNVNIEDIRIDHDPSRPAGLVELVVDETRATRLTESLESGGWVVHR